MGLAHRPPEINRLVRMRRFFHNLTIPPTGIQPNYTRNVPPLDKYTPFAMGFSPPLKKKCANRTKSECFRGNCGNNMATPIFTIWQQKGLIWQHCPMILYETLILQG